MKTITAIQRQLLRTALGLSFYATTPTRNWLPDADARRHEADVAALEAMGYFKVRVIIGPSGAERYVEITPAGRELAMQEPQTPPPQGN